MCGRSPSEVVPAVAIALVSVDSTTVVLVEATKCPLRNNLICPLVHKRPVLLQKKKHGRIHVTPSAGAMLTPCVSLGKVWFHGQPADDTVGNILLILLYYYCTSRYVLSQ